LNNLRNSVLLKLIRKPNSLAHIRLSLVPKLPSKASTNLGAPHMSSSMRWRKGVIVLVVVMERFS
ncbi:MAG: hypothetical protein ACI89J_004709, partial [Hyphomicrobiaceae bacterium]